MAYIEWSDELKTGIEPIDQDHRVLVSLLNQVYANLNAAEERATLGTVLNSLYEYTQYHFRREEMLQDLVGYPDLEAHRRTHAALADRVDGIRHRYAIDPTSVQAVEVLEFLRSWLVDHILDEDMAYRDACLGHPDAIAQVAAVAFGDSDGERPRAVVNWPELRVLVVEDNRNFQMVVQTILRSLGVRTVVMTREGGEGLERLAAGDIDLVLCDWRMEGMNGLDFVLCARQSDHDVPIIMMSGYSDALVRAQALAAGVDRFLEKPITARGFLEAAMAVLGRRAQA